MLMNVNIAASRILLIMFFFWKTHVSDSVISMSKCAGTTFICNTGHIGSCIKPVIFSPVYKSLHASYISIDKPVRSSINCKPVKFFIMW